MIRLKQILHQKEQSHLKTLAILISEVTKFEDDPSGLFLPKEELLAEPSAC